MEKDARQYLAEIGSKGGKKKGKSKSRGNSDYYSQLSRKRKLKTDKAL